jgi:glycosyltransferase involved in cell wall biosynthesis
MSRPSISFVFPAYNESLNLPALVENAFKAASSVSDDFEIIVVDDGSKDNTIAVLEELKRKFGKKLFSIHLSPNQGYATALKTGFLNAKKDFIFYSDADNQFDLSEVSLLIDKAEGMDMVIGYRKDRQDNSIRLFVSKCYNILISCWFGLKIRDIDCAFKLFRKDLFERIEIKLKKFLIDTEILVKANRLGMKIAQVGVTHLPRLKGQTTVKPGDVLFTLKGLFKLSKDLRRQKNLGNHI